MCVNGMLVLIRQETKKQTAITESQVGYQKNPKPYIGKKNATLIPIVDVEVFNARRHFYLPHELSEYHESDQDENENRLEVRR
jgi:hypothetical protein